MHDGFLRTGSWPDSGGDHDLLPGHLEKSPDHVRWLGWAVYIGAALILVAVINAVTEQHFLPNEITRPAPYLVTIGVIGIWRWSWQGVHLVRALIYRHLKFPALRRAADRARRPPHLYFVVPSYRMRSAVNAAVYRRLFDEVAAYGVPTSIVACITDPADARVIDTLFRCRRDLPEGCRIHLAAQAGTGKRDAMADALRLIAAELPPPGSQVVLMDGDTVLSIGSLRKACSLLAAHPDVGALTTDNVPLVKGGAITREWYRLRMAHRDNLMCSMSLSRKVLVLTGRFSVFRAEIATAADFILTVRRDVIDHARLGRIVFVTGDDKSTWFAVLRRGWNMLYAPDTVVHPIEELPASGFVRSSVALMSRWYGNMVRGNIRALRLGPRRCGWFTFTCLIDQRISMWTSLVGPTAMVVASILYGPVCILYYALWVMGSRGLVCLVYFISTGRFHPIFPLVLYYNQVVGSAIKIYATFHPHRQKWTRQGVRERHAGGLDLLRGVTSGLYAALSVSLFMLGVVIVVGVINVTEHRLGVSITYWTGEPMVRAGHLKDQPIPLDAANRGLRDVAHRSPSGPLPPSAPRPSTAWSPIGGIR